MIKVKCKSRFCCGKIDINLYFIDGPGDLPCVEISSLKFIWTGTWNHGLVITCSFLKDWRVENLNWEASIIHWIPALCRSRCNVLKSQTGFQLHYFQVSNVIIMNLTYSCTYLFIIMNVIIISLLLEMITRGNTRKLS